MLQAKAIIKPLMGLTIAATMLIIGAIITIGIGGYIGIGSSTASTILCNSYLILKYNFFASQIYLTTFITAIISAILSLMQCVFTICFFIRCRQIESNNSSQSFNLSSLQVNRHYIFCSLSILGLIITAGYYAGMFIEKGICLNTFYLNILVILILSSAAMLLLLICLIILIQYAIRRPILEGENTEGDNNKMNPHQLKASQKNNVFQMQGGSEMYKTVKRQNRQNFSNSDKNQPLLYQNSPIPIHQYNNDITFNKALKTQQMGESFVESNRHEGITSYNNRNRPFSPERFQAQYKKSKLHEIIEKKKKKFRQINPFKKQFDPNDITHQDDGLLNEKPKINGIQKSNKQLLQESKKPLRKAPHISSLYAAMEEQKRKVQYQQLGDIQRKNKLNRIKQQKQQQLVTNDDEQPKKSDQVNQNIASNLNIKEKMENNQEEQVFFHKPKIDGVIDTSRKKKPLFDEEVEQPSPILFLQDEKNDEDVVVVINKLRENKILRKSQMNKPIVKQAHHHMSNTVKTKTKEQLQLQFLKRKFQQQQDQPEPVSQIIAEEQQVLEEDVQVVEDNNK